MTSISSWVLSIVGIVFIGVLVDIILPDGQMSKYVKNIFAIVTVFVIVSPISNLLNADLDVSVFDEYDISVDLDFLSNYNSCLKQSLEDDIKQQALEKGMGNIFVEICLSEDEDEFIVEKIIVDISGIVILEGFEHIDKYTEITDIVEGVLLIEKERIVFYE